MTNPPNSDSQAINTPTNDIQQKVVENSGQAIAQMIGGFAVGQLTVYLSNIPTGATAKAATTPSELGENPYQGLKTFRENDGDRFFGRDEQIAILLEKFHGLHVHSGTVRILPIYGPSGSGKSSLARAGLIPALGKQPLRGKDRCRVVSLTPGLRPLETLANVLAQIITNDPMPVEKAEEFERVLKKENNHQKFEGLRRIASTLPDIDFLPLIILVDQFEEIYTYQAQNHQFGNDERDAFVENLLCAAGDPSQNVSVILTMRSDFLGKTQQQHEILNTLFSSQGHLVPAMQREQLAIAITEPAKRAGYNIDRATVNLLIKDSHGLEGALPLLQFALMQIWEGLLIGVSPADTLEKIGGVGGALASEAKRLYEALTIEQQQIARSAFLSMLHLHVDRNNNRRVTRRRSTISEIMRDTYSEQAVREVIECFAKPGVWILVTSSDKKGKEEIEMVEIAHEALINNWKELEGWLDLQWESLIKKRKIEEASLEWKNRNKSKDYLLQGRILRDAKEFQRSQKDNPETSLSVDAKEFLHASVRKKRISGIWVTGYFVVPAIISIIALHFLLINKANQILFATTECKPNPEARFFVDYLVRFGYKSNLKGINLCNSSLGGINLQKAKLQNSQFQNANLFGANLRDTSLKNANFEAASLPFADLRFAFIVETRFVGAVLADANLENAYLDSSNLTSASFERANLKKAKLFDVDFSNTNLAQADLTDAEFENPLNLNNSQLLKAKLCRTILPSKFQINKNKDCP
jgi:hypothetical protein